MNEYELEGKTQVGGLDFKIAAAACYIPISGLNLVASLIFLVGEPKPHRFVRFHAVQSAILFALFVGGSLGAVILGMIVFPLILVLPGSMLMGVLAEVSEDLAGLVGLIVFGLSSISYVGGAIIGIALSMCFLPAFLITAGLVITGKTGRWPIIGGFVERFV